VYYLTMGLVFLGALPKLLQKPGYALKIWSITAQKE
jgi:hypothetical protein